jgi:tetratricopeptide (TPR) repeat protein
MDQGAPPPRPPWAARVERAAERLSPWARRLLRRPSEGALQALSAVDRPGGAVPIPEAVRAEALATLQDPLALGRAAWDQGAYAEALHHFGAALAKDPRSAWAWHGRGDALQLLGAHADARAAYAEAARLQPREPLHPAGEANAAEALGEAEGARAARARAAALRARR